MTGRTRLYLAGDTIPIENFLRERAEDFPNCGVLVSFFYARTGGTSQKRLQHIVEDKDYPLRPAPERMKVGKRRKRKRG